MLYKNMLKAAASQGAHFTVMCDGETDYEGTSVGEAIDAIEAVYEADVYIRVNGERGWVYIVFDLDQEPGEEINDCGGWCSDWLDANVTTNEDKQNA